MAVWSAVIGLIVSMGANIAFFSFRYGRLTQKQSSDQDYNDKRFDAINKDVSEIACLNREHQTSDQEHFSDSDLHWGSREREWMNLRFENIEAMLKELLKRGDNEKTRA